MSKVSRKNDALIDPSSPRNMLRIRVILPLRNELNNLTRKTLLDFISNMKFYLMKDSLRTTMMLEALWETNFNDFIDFLNILEQFFKAIRESKRAEIAMIRINRRSGEAFQVSMEDLQYHIRNNCQDYVDIHGNKSIVIPSYIWRKHDTIQHTISHLLSIHYQENGEIIRREIEDSYDKHYRKQNESYQKQGMIPAVQWLTTTLKSKLHETNVRSLISDGGEEICSICREAPLDGDTEFSILDCCPHLMCLGCAEILFFDYESKYRCCPICRRKVKEWTTNAIFLARGNAREEIPMHDLRDGPEELFGERNNLHSRSYRKPDSTNTNSMHEFSNCIRDLIYNNTETSVLLRLKLLGIHLFNADFNSYNEYSLIFYSKDFADVFESTLKLLDQLVFSIHEKINMENADKSLPRRILIDEMILLDIISVRLHCAIKNHIVHIQEKRPKSVETYIRKANYLLDKIDCIIIRYLVSTHKIPIKINYDSTPSFCEDASPIQAILRRLVGKPVSGKVPMTVWSQEVLWCRSQMEQDVDSFQNQCGNCQKKIPRDRLAVLSCCAYTMCITCAESIFYHNQGLCQESTDCQTDLMQRYEKTCNPSRISRRVTSKRVTEYLYLVWLPHQCVMPNLADAHICRQCPGCRFPLLAWTARSLLDQYMITNNISFPDMAR